MSGWIELRIHDNTMLLHCRQIGNFRFIDVGALMDPLMNPILLFALRLIRMAQLHYL